MSAQVRSPISRFGRFGVTAVAILIGIWLLAIAILLWMNFSVGMELWADSYSDRSERTEELQRAAARLTLWLAGVGAGGAVLITVGAFAADLVKTGVAFMVLSALLTCGGGYIAVDAYRTLQPDPVPSPRPTHCVEFSGGDTRCPGG